MQFTENYKLKMPEQNESYNIQNENDNMSIIDVELAKKLDKDDLPRENVYCGLTTGTATMYTAKANPTLVAYKDGMFVTIIPHIACGNNPTLSIDGLGILNLKNSSGDNLIAGDMKANIPYVFVRVGSSFFMRNGNNIKALLEKAFGKYPWIYSGITTPQQSGTKGACIFKNKVYMLGTNEVVLGSTVNYMYIYDIVNNTWKKSANGTFPRYYERLCACNDKIYILGGYLADGNIENGDLYIYDILTDSFSQGASMTNFRTDKFAVCVVNNKIYVIGANYNTSVEIYDTVANTWSSTSSVNDTIISNQAHLYNDNIYCAGYLGIHIYNLLSNTWSLIPKTIDRWNTTSALVDDKIFIMGGMLIDLSGNGFDTIYDNVDIYNITKNSWESSTTMPVASWGGSNYVYNKSIYLIGGFRTINENPIGALNASTDKIYTCITNWDKF